LPSWPGWPPELRIERLYASAPNAAVRPSTSVDQTTAASSCCPSRGSAAVRAPRCDPPADGSPPAPHQHPRREPPRHPLATRTRDSLHDAGTLPPITTPRRDKRCAVPCRPPRRVWRRP
jgi:hypothetical protein